MLSHEFHLVTSQREHCLFTVTRVLESAGVYHAAWWDTVDTPSYQAWF